MGQTVMLTTHYMEEADQLCDRVAIMDHGKILALDTPMNLKRSIGADTIVTVKVSHDGEGLAAILGEPRRRRRDPRDRDLGGGCTRAGSDQMVPRIVSAVEDSDFDLLDLSVAEPSLETVFINLTGKELREA